jgi:mono/diheme cytochrome c family protein
MKRFALVAALVIFSAAPAALAGSKGNVEDGKVAYKKHCMTCHGADGNGKPMMEQLLNVKFPPLSGQKAQSVTDEELTEMIKHGKGKMKPVKDITNKEIVNVIAYFRTMKK